MNSPAYASSRRGGASTTAVTLTEGGESSSYYVFNVGADGGFIIVSADDAAIRPVLGYAMQGSFDPDSLPVNLADWLAGYDRELAYARSAGLATGASTPQTVTAGAPAVGPLLTTKWSQGAPYNNLCTELAIHTGWNAVTGCTATAMAQVMNYHEWPVTGTGSNSYTVGYTINSNSVNVTFSSDFSTHTYGWANMKDNYSDNYSAEEATAVAMLMHDCGVALYSTYGSSTGAYTYMPGSALIEHFGYDKSLMVRNKDHYTQTEWDNLLRAELDQHRPLLYSGQAPDQKSGHAFVCDGYDDAGYFHFNWGWGGSYDGWFVTSSLIPQGSGIGGNASGYTSEQCAWFGVKKDAGGSRRADFVAGSDFTSTDGTNFSYTLNVGAFSSYSAHDALLRWAIAVENLSSGAIQYEALGGTNFRGGTSLQTQLNPSSSSSLAAGTYKVYPVVRFGDDVPWEKVYFSSTRQSFVIINVDGNGSRAVANAPVTGVTLNTNAERCRVGNTVQLTATVLPLSAANTAVVWESSQPSVATVDNAGLVTAVAEGTTTITVRTDDGGFTATCVLEVLPALVIGETFIEDGIKYAIKGNDEVAVVPAYYTGVLNIPSVVNHLGSTFTVTSFLEEAFAGCTGLTRVTIPSSVTVLGNYAFKGCTALQALVVNWTATPPSVDSNVFEGLTPSGIKLVVPFGTASNYSAAEVWKTFDIDEYVKHTLQAIGGMDFTDNGTTAIDFLVTMQAVDDIYLAFLMEDLEDSDQYQLNANIYYSQISTGTTYRCPFSITANGIQNIPDGKYRVSFLYKYSLDPFGEYHPFEFDEGLQEHTFVTISDGTWTKMPQTAIDGKRYLLNSNGTAVVTANGYKNGVSIPATVTSSGNTYVVGGVDEAAFRMTPSLTSVTLHSNLGLADGTLPAGVTKRLVINDADHLDYLQHANTYASVTYNRATTAGVYGTLCLPFAVDNATLARYHFYAYSGFNGDELQFTEVEAVEPGVPYLYCLREGAEGGTMTASYVTLSASAATSLTASGWILQGYYAGSVITGPWATPEYYALSTNNTLVRARKSVTIYPYRALFHRATNQQEATCISLEGTDGSTAILSLRVDGSLGDAEDGTMRVYDLQGRPVDVAEPLAPGIYLINGKKTLVK